MSDELVKALLESLSSEQKQQLISEILNSNVKTDEPQSGDEVKQKPKNTKVNEDFTVTRNNELGRGKTPVKARKNKWVDEGEDRDPNFDPATFERMGKAARNRGRAKKVQVECHVCGKNFHINENLIYGEFTRCNRCTGR
tara:strand:- start:119 stop:538 length:420 start_codon:yes stop_codon:yes gene_type:complete